MIVRAFAFTALAAAAAGCGRSHLPELAAGEPASYRSHLEPLVQKRCLSCHTAEDPKAGLVLEPGRGWEALVGPSSVQVSSLRLVSPGSPESSYLWHKLDHTAKVGSGMPRTLLGAKRLPPAELERFRRWIEDGAQP
jgi:hypothetical protein